VRQGGCKKQGDRHREQQRKTGKQRKEETDQSKAHYENQKERDRMERRGRHGKGDRE
jgi:hypothetical protein